MGVKTRNQSGDFIQIGIPTGLVAATVTGGPCSYPFVRKGVVSHLVIAIGAVPTGGTGTTIIVDVIKNPTSVTGSAITGGASIFGGTKPTLTIASATANSYIEFGTTGAGNEVLSSKVGAGWAVGTGLNSGILMTSLNPGDVFYAQTTTNGTATTGTFVSLLFSLDVYPGA